MSGQGQPSNEVLLRDIGVELRDVDHSWGHRVPAPVYIHCPISMDGVRVGEQDRVGEQERVG